MRAVRCGAGALVHAGEAAVGGKAILLPGRGFAGKTTLTLALAAAGAEFLSDEIAVIDDRGLVHPYPRPVGLRDASRREVGRPRIEELGGRTAAGGCRSAWSCGPSTANPPGGNRGPCRRRRS